MGVLIVDDSACFRRAARALLERRGYEVVGEADTAAAAFEQVTMLDPAALLLDVTLPDGTAFGAAASLAQRRPALAILPTSPDAFGSCYGLAEECGARGFVLKSQLGGCDLDRFWPRP